MCDHRILIEVSPNRGDAGIEVGCHCVEPEGKFSHRGIEAFLTGGWSCLLPEGLLLDQVLKGNKMRIYNPSCCINAQGIFFKDQCAAISYFSFQRCGHL